MKTGERTAIDLKLEKIAKLVKFIDRFSVGRMVGDELRLQHRKSGKDEAELVADVTTGTCVLYSWDVSFHNGDAYANEKELLSPEVAVKELDAILLNLESLATQKAEEDIKEEERTSLRRAAKERVRKLFT